jgi:hypothetical protein
MVSAGWVSQLNGNGLIDLSAPVDWPDAALQVLQRGADKEVLLFEAQLLPCGVVSSGYSTRVRFWRHLVGDSRGIVPALKCST